MTQPKFENMGFMFSKGLIGVGVSLAVAFKVSKAQARLSVSLPILPVDIGVELLDPSLVSHLPVCCHAPHHVNNVLNL